MDIDLQKAHRLNNSGSVILVTCGKDEKYNIITLAWQTPLSINPPLVGISVAPSHYSHGLIRESGEFTINIPSREQLDIVHYCGTHSGKNVNKIERLNLCVKPGRIISPPHLVDSLGQIECELRAHHKVGDHSFFVGEVIYACVKDDAFDGVWNSAEVTLHHLGGDSYQCGSEILHPQKLE